MTFKTILVHVDQSRHAAGRIRWAARFARAHGACLLGAAMTGIPRAVFPNGYNSPPGSLSARHFDPLVANARRALADFVDIARGAGTDHDARLVCDVADDGLALLARFADLVVTTRDDPDESTTDGAVRVPESVILRSARPLIALPFVPALPAAIGKVILAWDGSREASTAVHAALPLLHAGVQVLVASLETLPDRRDEIAAEHADLLAYLRRHGVDAAALVRQSTASPGEDLLALAAEYGADLLVMGCYGHAQWRELCLGGASRSVLAGADLPVLFAH